MKSHIERILIKALEFEFLSLEEGMMLLESAGTAELMYVGDQIRQKQVTGNNVHWTIDRKKQTKKAVKTL